MSKKPDEPSAVDVGQPPEALVRALRRLLRPLVRLLLAQGVTYPWLGRLLKSLFVEVAVADFGLDGKPPTDSRISLLTGVHRKDVKRLRAAESDVVNIPESVSLGAHLVAVWTGKARYLDARGRPLPLPRLAAGAEPSFEELVGSVSKDIRARVVLDEWLRLGAARLDEQDRVCLNFEAFVPDKGFDEKAFFLGQNLHDHIAAAGHNLLGGKPPFLERSVYYDDLPPQAAQILAQLAEQTGMAALQAVNRKAMALQDPESGAGKTTRRINFGIYYYSEDADAASDDNDHSK